MKYINKHILKVACSLLFAGLIGCNLDELPLDTASKSAIFDSESGLKLYTNSFYELLPTAFDGNFQVDDNCDLVARNGIDALIAFNVLSPTTSSGWTWTALRSINFFIQNCEKSPVSNKNHYLGLAHFWRAYFYFIKVKRFGDVPWIDRIIEYNDSIALYAPRDNRFDVMEHVLEDLNYAIENISTTSDATCSTITKNVARAFKTRVCLYEASLRKYHTVYGKQSTANRWYEEVVKTADEITGLSLHGGTNAYRNLFLQKSPYSDETILAVLCDGDLKVYNNRTYKTNSPTYGNRPSFNRRFINSYLLLDGTPFTDKPDYKTTPFAEEVKNRDLRLKATIRLGDYKRTNNGVSYPAPPTLTLCYTGYQIIKGCYDESVPYDTESAGENAHIIIRWAEVLLNKAEALAELGTMTDDDWASTVGLLRARGGITGATLTKKPTVADPYMIAFYNNKFTDPVLLEVFRDRAIELVLEALRPDDLIRWHVGELLAEAPLNGMYVPELGNYDLNEDGIIDVCFYSGTRPSSPATESVDVTPPTGPGKRVLSDNTSGEIIWNPGAREWLEKKYLYPIPETDLLKNPALLQNPGW
jgi:hypothetical protein